MRTSAFSLGFLSCTLLLTGCWGPSPAPVSEEEASSSSVRAATQFVTYEGTVRLPGDGSPYFVLDRGDGSTVYAQSSTINLDERVGTHVRISGNASLSQDGVHVLIDVTSVSDTPDSEEPEVLTEDGGSSLSSVEASSSSASPVLSSSSAAASSVLSSARSSAPASSRSSSAASSVALSSSSSVLSDTTQDAKTSVMAKAKTDASLFTQKYCSTHVGFCISVHKNWYYQSFGVNVPPSLWHVEIGPEPVEDVGDGVIIFTLQSGDLSGTDGSVETHGDYIVVMKQWTGGKHFEVSAPASLRSAAEQIAASLTVYQDGQ